MLNKKVIKVLIFASPSPKDFEQNGVVVNVGEEIYASFLSNIGIFRVEALRIKWENGTESVRLPNEVLFE